MIELIYLKNKIAFEADFLIAVDKFEEFKNDLKLKMKCGRK